MSKKKAFALRLDEDLLKALEKWASDEFEVQTDKLNICFQMRLKLQSGIQKNNKQKTNNGL